jgi:hypothetical protein
MNINIVKESAVHMAHGRRLHETDMSGVALSISMKLGTKDYDARPCSIILYDHMLTDDAPDVYELGGDQNWTTYRRQYVRQEYKLRALAPPNMEITAYGINYIVPRDTTYLTLDKLGVRAWTGEEEPPCVDDSIGFVAWGRRGPEPIKVGVTTLDEDLVKPVLLWKKD